MSKKDIKASAERKGIFLYEDHRLLTRRDFLGSGLMQFSAALLAPTVLTQLLQASVAEAASCVSGTVVSTLPPFVQVNLSGGAGLAMNYIPRGRNGELIPNLSLMGLGSRNLLLSNRNVNDPASPNRLETEVGVAGGFFHNSGFLRGLRAVAATANLPAAAASYLDSTAFIAIPVQSRDDSQMNRVGLASLIHRAGLVGTASSLKVLTGQSFDTSTALAEPPTPILVRSLNDLDGAVGVVGPLGALATATNKTKLISVFDRIKNLSISRANQLASSNASVVRDLIECSTRANADMAAAPKPDTSPLGNVDPQNAGVRTVWGLAANSNPGSQEAVFAGCVMNTLKGLAGPSQLNIGGNDYHNNTRTSGDQKDEANGRAVGRILQTAAALGRPLFLVVTSDGSVRSPESQMDDAAPWTSDRGQAGCTYVFIYNPAGRIGLRNDVIVPNSGAVALPNQIGYFTDGQSADQNFIPAWDPERAVLAAFANYLKFGDPTGWRQKYISTVQTAAQEVGLPSDPIPLNLLDAMIRVG